jgi:hypothetical protein
VLGVSFEDRQDLLGHKPGRITTDYSEAEISNFLQAANVVCEQRSGVKLTVLRRGLNTIDPAKVPQDILLSKRQYW